MMFAEPPRRCCSGRARRVLAADAAPRSTAGDPFRPANRRRGCDRSRRDGDRRPPNARTFSPRRMLARTVRARGQAGCKPGNTLTQPLVSYPRSTGSSRATRRSRSARIGARAHGRSVASAPACTASPTGLAPGDSDARARGSGSDRPGAPSAVPARPRWRWCRPAPARY
jgi:hypothetical protein